MRSIHPGLPAEVDACVELWLNALAARDGRKPVEGTAERCRSKFALPRVSWLVAREDAEVLGFGLMTAPGTGAESDPPGAAYLALLAVDPAQQGRGFGRSLLEALVSDANEAGHRTAVLHVLAENVRASRLYTAHGWRAEGEAFRHPLDGRRSQTYVLDPVG